MANTIVKLHDDNVSLEEFIIVDEEDVGKVKELLDDYRKDNPGYNIDEFLGLLDVNDIDYESPPVERVCF